MLRSSSTGGQTAPAIHNSASSLFRPRRFASRERRGFFVRQFVLIMSQLWHADKGLIRLQAPRVSAVVDLSRPAFGMHGIVIDGESHGNQHLLGVDLPLAPAKQGDAPLEYFLRGGDLAVAYADQPQPAARTQVYWRAASLPDVIASVQLLVSVQTNRLDGCPQLAACSRLTSESVLRTLDASRATFVSVTPENGAIQTSSACGYLFRLSGDKYSFAQLVHPADVQKTSLQMQRGNGSPSYELNHELFAEHLEKGVILRARMLGLLLDRANDQEAAAAHFANFLAADLPLTT
jgi:hypothetical protein